ncbi:avidin/streptavidin family protein [Paremcibacter congregatus]|uniref:Avidin n=1 Tax=Paremcibacter congregatus TaxID=2043170 RepID=A0A2G4YTT4_9PROT|nr:avidin/streptavidin family protein [Paremcibacter congregatus]PHZ85703.1 hypothetical protein CRD36_03175 [Paremcibacter congregatus]QDE26664.1 hypothetical protein FIV45_04935 [Paremcibacter congregatus]
MHLKKLCLSLPLLMLSTAFSQAMDCTKPVGDWRNDVKSVMSIEKVDPATGRITGTYISKNGAKNPMSGWLNTSAPVEGKHNATAIHLSVNWQGEGAITAWTGYCHMVDGSPVIQTEDLITFTNADFAWSHVISNHDTLVPVKQ